MIIPKRTIPRVGIAALVLGGCGDDVDSPAEVASAFCRYEQRCDPEDFSYDYSSLSECRTEVAEYLNAYIDAYRDAYGAACGDAFAAYYRCLGQDLADQNGDGTCFETGEIACSPEYDRLLAACPVD